jgi:hypothetical protein
MGNLTKGKTKHMKHILIVWGRRRYSLGFHFQSPVSKLVKQLIKLRLRTSARAASRGSRQSSNAMYGSPCVKSLHKNAQTPNVAAAADAAAAAAAAGPSPEGVSPPRSSTRSQACPPAAACSSSSRSHPGEVGAA